MALPRLKRRREFLRVAKAGKRAARPGLVLQAMPVDGVEAPLRVGFTATKKLGNAVVRNRTKRRLRAAARLVLGAEPPPGWDLVLIGREGTAGRPWKTLLGDVNGALRQAGVLPGDGQAPRPRQSEPGQPSADRTASPPDQGVSEASGVGAGGGDARPGGPAA